MAKITKEFIDHMVEDKTYSCHGGSYPLIREVVCVLKISGKDKLTIKDTAKLFNEAANDFGGVSAEAVRIEKDCVKVYAEPPIKILGGYKKAG